LRKLNKCNAVANLIFLANELVKITQRASLQVKVGQNFFMTSLTAEFQKMNHNVKLVFLFTFLQSFGRGIWMGSVLSAYIFFLADESHNCLE
jgi:hypothetical protein